MHLPRQKMIEFHPLCFDQLAWLMFQHRLDAINREPVVN